jgi:hypothetical protein
MALYVVIVVIGATICWAVGVFVERFSETVSLPVFLILFFLNFYVSWRLALRLTEPKKQSAA